MSLARIYYLYDVLCADKEAPKMIPSVTSSYHFHGDTDDYVVRRVRRRWYNRKKWWVLYVYQGGVERYLTEHNTMAEAIQAAREMRGVL